jgi:predicted transcriptional regulator
MRMSTNCLLQTLRDCPSGLTAKEVAHRLGADHSNIGSRLSKLAAYGIISKTRGRIASDASPCAIYFPPAPNTARPIQNSCRELANSP